MSAFLTVASIHVYPWVLPILGGAIGGLFGLWDGARRRERIMQRIIDAQNKQISILEAINHIEGHQP